MRYKAESMGYPMEIELSIKSKLREMAFSLPNFLRASYFYFINNISQFILILNKSKISFSINRYFEEFHFVLRLCNYLAAVSYFLFSRRVFNIQEQSELPLSQIV